MPRTRNQQRETDLVIIKQKPNKLIVKQYLNNRFWDLAKKTGEKFECPVCLEEIVEKHSFAMARCGHPIHFDCLFYSKKPKVCAVCKEGESDDDEPDYESD